MVLNNVTKFHKILIKTICFRERTLFQKTNAITATWTIIELDKDIILLIPHHRGGEVIYQLVPQVPILYAAVKICPQVVQTIEVSLNTETTHP